MFSAVIIANNESETIGKCIGSLQAITDDIVLVDSGSTDDTPMIAKAMGARVYTKNWEGYGANKNYGNARAKFDWIISLDGDEVLSEQLIHVLQNLEPKKGHIYQLNSLVNYAGQWIRHSGWYPRHKNRVFNRREVQWDDQKVHEDLTPLEDKTLIKLSGDLLHYSYKSVEEHHRKVEEYARLRAEQWLVSGASPHLLKRYFGSWFAFFKTYLLKLGFLDGRAGLTIAGMNARLIRLQVAYFDQLKKVSE